MKLERLCTILVLLLASVSGANASTYEGYAEKSEVLEEPAIIEERPVRDVEGHIGILVSLSGRVSRVHPGSPAEKAGILKGDRVILVDGLKTGIDDISGPPGTKVTLEIERKHCADHLTMTVERVGVDEIQP